MVVKKPRIVIIGAGMAGLTAANKLYKSGVSKGLFELCVVEGGNRIGGRINTSEFGGDRIEMGATWIHGIGGSPIHKIAQEINSLESEQPWECMDGFLDHDPLTIAENGYVLDPSLVHPVSTLFKKLMDFAQGKADKFGDGIGIQGLATGKPSLGSFLRQGLECYWESRREEGEEEVKGCGNWNKKSIEEAIFAVHENIQRTFTSASDLLNLDYHGESEYCMFPGEEITIAKGYSSIIQSLASVLPVGCIQLGRKVSRIDWQPEGKELGMDNEHGTRPVTVHFCDGTTMSADHVVVTVSLGVLKAGISRDSDDSGSGLFHPPLPNFKTQAITRLGYGVVNKLFLHMSAETELGSLFPFPFLHLAFHRPDSEFRHPKIPWWMRRTASLSPVYIKSSVLLAWFVGEEALELESLNDEEILDGVSTTMSSFLPKSHRSNSHSHKQCNGNVNCVENSNGIELKFDKILKTQWGNDPLFFGSYSYVAVGSSVDDLDAMAVPLPKISTYRPSAPPQLQILFAGEATHRTHYSTTHGAYFSGLREANRLLQHYHCIDV